MSWRYNPPPGWPVPPEGWQPPPDWVPDPSWPPAPPNWNFWVPATPPAEPPAQPAEPPAAPAPPAASPGHYPPPYVAGVPGGRPSRGPTWAIAAGAGALVLLLCTGGVAAVALNWDQISGDDDPTPTNPPVASSGWEDCPAEPDTCNSGDREPGGTMVWAIDNYPTAYFPWSTAGGSTATLQAISGILPTFGQFLPSGEYAYNLDVLAEEPRIINEDPLQTEWQISPDAAWDDGTPITADDVIITWKMNTPEEDGYCTGCESRSLDLLTERVEGSTDGKTVTITYRDGVSDPEWFAAYGAESAAGGLVPAHVAVQNGWDPDNPEDLGAYFTYLHETPPEFSGGPYLIESFDLSTRVVKVPNPSWYGEMQPTLDELVLEFMGDPAVWVPALQAGELDGGSPSGWSEETITQLQDLDDVQLYVQSGPVWDHLDVNMDNEWLGSDPELRRAIFTAIDSRAIAEQIFGRLFPDYTVRTNHVFGEDSEFYVDRLTDTGQGSGDIDYARSLLADAGYEGYEGSGGLTLDGEQVDPFRLRSTNSPQRLVAAEIIATQLDEIGIEVRVEPTDDLIGMLTEQDYDLVLFGWSGSPLFKDTGSQYWGTGSSSNFGGYSNEEVDSLIEQEQAASTLEEAATLHDLMMEIVVDDAYVLPLYDTPIYTFASDEFVNVRDNPNSSLRALYQTEGWGVRAG